MPLGADRRHFFAAAFSSFRLRGFELSERILVAAARFAREPSVSLGAALAFGTTGPLSLLVFRLFHCPSIEGQAIPSAHSISSFRVGILSHLSVQPCIFYPDFLLSCLSDFS